MNVIRLVPILLVTVLVSGCAAWKPVAPGQMVSLGIVIAIFGTGSRDIR